MVAINVDINLEGEFSQEEIDNGMFILGELIVNKIKENIREMKLQTPGGGKFLQLWFSKWDGNTLTIESGVDYSLYLEYGTYGYSQQYGLDKFPSTPHPKKKDMPAELRKMFPSGMQPFAPIRRVVYNQAVMQELAKQAFS